MCSKRLLEKKLWVQLQSTGFPQLGQAGLSPLASAEKICFCANALTQINTDPNLRKSSGRNVALVMELLSEQIEINKESTALS